MSIVSDFIKDLRKGKRLRALRNGFPLSYRFKSEYLISTDIGLMHIAGSEGRLLTRRPGYGIAINGNEVYFSFENADLSKVGGASSFVVKVDKMQLLEGAYFHLRDLYSAKVLYKQSFSSSNGRIHQLAFSRSRDCLFAAASQENSIIRIHRDGRIHRFAPFLDKFDVPILFDQNHINSVLPIDGAVYFVSYKAGGNSMICYMEDGRSYGWQVGRPGFHDVVLTENGFYTCDTFGDLEHGRVLDQDDELLKGYFREHGCAPRGIAGTSGEILVGHSHKGPRAKRFDGKGGVVVTNGTEAFAYVELPASQVYPVIGTDGCHFLPHEAGKHEEFKNVLTKRFGTIMEIGPYQEELLAGQPES